ncbi:MAG TPA: diguanylate cyclase [Gaiellaceae bacterium]|nr:diguanylate cyclase [Gaiellaceae bacterium]
MAPQTIATARAPGGSVPAANGRTRPLVDSYKRLAEIFHEVLSEESFEHLIERIADTLADLVPYEALHIYEADLARRELVPVFARSDWLQEIMRMRPAFGQGITGWAVANRTPVLANRAHLDARVAVVPGTPVEPEALISIPLVARGGLKGALNIYRIGEEASFDEDEFELAQWFGDAAALALDNLQVRAALEHQAQTDSLTGLYNHRYFHERLRAELTRATRARDSVALLMFDIDDFKRVNDICGHGVGDQVLVSIGAAAASLVRASDVVCRIGGEEFAVVMPSCRSVDAVGLARRLQGRLSREDVEAAGEVTVSVGIAEGPAHATNPRELVACAETSMMTAKARGKSGIVVFGDEVGERPQAEPGDRDARSIAHLKMLQSVASRLNRCNSVREIGEAIVDELRMLIDYHSCRVYLVEGECLTPIAVKGDAVAGAETLQALRIEVGEGITGRVAETGKPMLIPNALDVDFGLTIPGTEPVDESVIAVPLGYGSRVSGVLFVSKLGAGQFDDNDLRLLEVLAGHAGAALENARLYDSLRREAEHAKTWLEFSDSISSLESYEAIEQETVETVARLLEAGVCSLWLQDRADGDFACAASVGYEADPGTTVIPSLRIPQLVGDTLLDGRKAPFVLTAEEMRAAFALRQPELVVRAAAVAPLPSGHGVRGWITVRAGRDDDLARFTDERLRLLEGLAFRAATGLEKAVLFRDQQESAHVAAALLEFARALAAVDTLGEIHERIVRQTADLLEVPEAALWLQDVASGEVRLEAAFGFGPEQRERARAIRYPAETASRFADAPEPFVFVPEKHPDVPAIRDAGDAFRYGVAPFRFDGRLGFVVAGAPESIPFDQRKLKMLAGLADQAKLAIASAR